MTYASLYKKGDVINGLSLVSDIWVEKEKARGVFVCSCGKEFKGIISSIVSGKAKSCGCLQRKVASTPRNNYVRGQKIGALTFLNRVDSKPGLSMANFLCDCGKEFVTRIESVKSLSTKSCGCKSIQMMVEKQTKHEKPQYHPNGVKKMPILKQPDIDRFWFKVAITANPNRCWNWTATGARYGMFKVGKADYKANRLAYWLSYKEDPAEMEVMHSCDNPKCCNPKHLSLGTHWENMQDMVKKGRSTSCGKFKSYF